MRWTIIMRSRLKNTYQIDTTVEVRFQVTADSADEAITRCRNILALPDLEMQLYSVQLED